MSFSWDKKYEPETPLMRYLDEKLPLPRFVYNAIGAGYSVPRNFNWMYNFGVLAGVALVVQIVTGIILAMHYRADGSIAFDSVEHIMRDVNGGWFFRYVHANGASMFLAVVYFHMGRGLYYGSYKPPREVVWLLGVVMFLLIMATAFMGYVLPWGQMSFWGAQVITGFFSALPLVGETIRVWLLGGSAPDAAALNRFFSLHYLLPFVILGVIILHVWALHIPGSGNPTGVEVKTKEDTLPFHPYYTAKDGVGVGVFMIVLASLVFFAPNMLGHPDNYVAANPLSTPAHIVPEWYFLPFYAILKSFTSDFLFIPAKLWGVLAMFGSILLLFFLPWLDTSPVRSCNYRPTYRKFLFVLFADLIVLGYVGGAEPTAVNVMLGQVATAYYFAHFLIILPLVSMMERPLPLPNSITESVMGTDTGRSGSGMPQLAPAE